MTRNDRQVPDGWQMVRLGDVAEVNRHSWNPTDGTSSILYLDLTAVIAPGTMDPPRRIRASDAPSRARRRVRTGDTLVSTVRPYLRGFARVREAPENLIASTGFAVVSPKPTVDGSFVYQHVMTPAFSNHLENAMTGQAYPAVRPRDVATYSLALPQLIEQRAIAAVLDSIDEAIERTEAVIAATEGLRDALLHELLTRGVPGWHTEWKEVHGIGKIPVDWEVVRLGDVAEVNPKRPKLYIEAHTPLTFIPMAAVGEKCAGIISREQREYCGIASGYTYFEENDVLFAKITPCLQNGKHALATRLTKGFGFGTTEFHVIRAGSSIVPRHLFRVLTQQRNIEKCARNFSGTAGQQRVQPETLKSLALLLPTLPEQYAIAAVLDEVDDAIKRAREVKYGLQPLKASAADALLTGQIRTIQLPELK